MQTVIKSSLLICFLIIVSCKKDCTPPPIEQNIVGTWSGSASLAGQTQQGGQATFKSDHTGNSPGEVFQASINGGPQIKDFNWQIEGDTSLVLEYKDGSSSFSTHYAIQSNTCDIIKLDYFVTTLTLARK